MCLAAQGQLAFRTAECSCRAMEVRDQAPPFRQALTKSRAGASRAAFIGRGIIYAAIQHSICLSKVHTSSLVSIPNAKTHAMSLSEVCEIKVCLLNLMVAQDSIRRWE